MLQGEDLVRNRKYGNVILKIKIKNSKEEKIGHVKTGSISLQT